MTTRQLLTIPIYVVALMTVMVTSYYADRTKQRSPFIIFPFCLAAVSIVILMALPKDRWPGAQYMMLFAVGAGLYPVICTVISWNGKVLPPRSRSWLMVPKANNLVRPMETSHRHWFPTYIRQPRRRGGFEHIPAARGPALLVGLWLLCGHRRGRSHKCDHSEDCVFP